MNHKVKLYVDTAENLNLSPVTEFKLFQTERVCRQQF